MRVIAAIAEPTVARRILECLALSSRAPPLSPSNETDLEPAMDPDAFEPTPVETQSDQAFDFNQSRV